jgi:uncharacterized membrane protein YqgA involved in biofilm formation
MHAKNFRLGSRPMRCLSLRMTGAFLNAIGILLGGLFGLACRRTLPAQAQIFFRNALGVSIVFFGVRLVWLNVNGPFLLILKQFFLAALSVVLGNLLGKLFRLQKISNYLGRHANHLIVSAQSGVAPNAAAGFNACTILFCAAPLGWLGAVTDGLSGYFWLLAVKAMMDGLAMIGFVKMFRWPAAISAFPVFLFFGTLTFVCQFYAAPFLDSQELTNSVNAAAGLVACAVALVIFEVRRVELANFMPALVVAPVLAKLLNH